MYKKENFQFQTLILILKSIIQYLKFILGGFSLKDKMLSYYLLSAISDPYAPHSKRLKKRISKHGPVLNLRHSFFNYLQLSFNLLDQFQMAICQEFYLLRIYDLSKIKFTPNRIIDCGAYQGYFSYISSMTFPKSEIYSIEANPNSCRVIKETIINNQKRLSNIVVVNGAITKDTCSNTPLKLVGSNSLKIEKNNNEADIYVDSIDLEKYIHVENLIIKMDIEGSEIELFPQLVSVLPNTCAIFLETHHGLESLDPIKKEFLKFGFSFEVLRARGLYIDIFAYREK